MGDILKIILTEWSPQSYLCREEVKKREEFQFQLGAQAASLCRRIFKEHGVGIGAFKGCISGCYGKRKGGIEAMAGTSAAGRSSWTGNGGVKKPLSRSNGYTSI